MCHLSLFPHPTDRLTRSLCYLKVSKRKKIDGFETKKAFLKEIELQIYFNIQSPHPPPTHQRWNAWRKNFEYLNLLGERSSNFQDACDLVLRKAKIKALLPAEEVVILQHWLVTSGPTGSDPNLTTYAPTTHHQCDQTLE